MKDLQGGPLFDATKDDQQQVYASLGHFKSLPRWIQNITCRPGYGGALTWKQIWAIRWRNARSDCAWHILCMFYRTINRDKIRTEYLAGIAYRKLQHRHLSLSERVIYALGSLSVVGGPVFGPNTILINEEYARRMKVMLGSLISVYWGEMFKKIQGKERNEALFIAMKAVEDYKKRE